LIRGDVRAIETADLVRVVRQIKSNTELASRGEPDEFVARCDTLPLVPSKSTSLIIKIAINRRD